jgi:hypothetical protein
MVNGELVAARCASGRRAGVSMDMTGVDLLTIRNGKIAEVRLFSEDGPAEDRFWGAPDPIAPMVDRALGLPRRHRASGRVPWSMAFRRRRKRIWKNGFRH